MILKDGSKIEKNFQTEVEDWKPLENLDENHTEVDVNETFILSSILGKESIEVDDVFPVDIVDKKDYSTTEVQEAMNKEVEKYKSFNVYEEVDDHREIVSIGARHA